MTPTVGPNDQDVVRQRCLIVAPSTVEFDSRTYRIASALVARGHAVTVLARLGPGLPAQERHPSGYTIVRVPVSTLDGLPGLLRRPVRWFRGRTGRSPVGRPDDGAEEAAVVPGLAKRGPRALGRLTTFVRGSVRLAAIGLTIRSQRLATERIAPAADVIHAMAYMGIPVGLAVGRRVGAPVAYDARDIYVDAANLARLPAPARALFARIERAWARRAARVITVNDPYAEVMTERFGVARPAVVMNCSYLRPTEPRAERRFHERLGLPEGTRVVLYQGGFSPDRGIEQLIDALDLLPENVVLVLLGYGRLQASLEARVAADPARRLRILPAVPPPDLLDWVASADVVAMPIQPTTLNHRLTTPNKLLEAIAVGIPVVASDLPGMAPIVRELGCGLVCDPTDPAAIAAAIRTILDWPSDVRRSVREATLAGARRTYNWESQFAVLLGEYERLTGAAW